MPSKTLPPEVFAAFNATGTLTLLDSGQGKTYRVDDSVLKPAALDPGYRYLPLSSTSAPIGGQLPARSAS